MSSFWGNMETLEEMAATIAHEIKNPLALALANLDLIKVSDNGEKYKKYCDIIEQELYRVNRLVLDLINITLSSESEETFDLTAMIDQLTTEYQARYETIFFSRQSGLSAAYFLGAVKIIRMVFTNILNNAIEAINAAKAISHKGIIEIIQENRTNSILIIINDNGVGLPQEMLMQPNEHYTSKAGGTGIGLRYCRTAIAKYGGLLTLQNRAEGGCSVTIELPLKDI